jgi:hypothetical protein
MKTELQKKKKEKRKNLTSFCDFFLKKNFNLKFHTCSKQR